MENNPRCIGLKLASALVLLAVLFSVQLFGQTDTVIVQDFFEAGERTLNEAVQAKIEAGTLSNTVFRLKPHGQYVLTATITVPAGMRLTIIAPEPGATQQTAPPQIVWAAETVANTYFNFRCHGDIVLKNVWLMYSNALGQQTFSALQIEVGPDTDRSVC
jgi:hypothetical protein